MSDLGDAIINWNELSDPMLKAMMIKRTSLPQDDATFLRCSRFKFENLTTDQQMIIVKEIFHGFDKTTAQEIKEAIN